MKNYKSIYFLLFFLCMLVSCYTSAQTPVRKGIYTLNNIKYEVADPSIYNGSYGIWRNVTPEIPRWKDIDGFPMDILRTKITNGEIWKNRVIAVLGSQKVQQPCQATSLYAFKFIIKEKN